MNKFIQYLKEKGYKIYGNKAVLLETEFNICEGYKTTAMGKQKSYWLELVPNKRKEDKEWNDDFLLRKKGMRWWVKNITLLFENIMDFLII